MWQENKGLRKCQKKNAPFDVWCETFPPVWTNNTVKLGLSRRVNPNRAWPNSVVHVRLCCDVARAGQRQFHETHTAEWDLSWKPLPQLCLSGNRAVIFHHLAEGDSRSCAVILGHPAVTWGRMLGGFQSLVEVSLSSAFIGLIRHDPDVLGSLPRWGLPHQNVKYGLGFCISRYDGF